jgi:hypothetical protein
MLLGIILAPSIDDYFFFFFWGGGDSNSSSLLHLTDREERDNNSKQQQQIHTKQIHHSKATVAYAWTLTKCGDFQSSAQGMIDSALVLRHSVHSNSVRTPSSDSQYDYRMYVFVHPQAAKCTEIMEDAGYTVLILEPPIDPKRIQSPYYKQTVHREWCCGSDEFIKLYAYTLTEHPIVVHLDIDFMLVKPMDDLFDGMLERNAEKRAQARSRIVLQHPNNNHTTNNNNMPQTIEAYLTRDYQQVHPHQVPLFQAGFLVVQPNLEVFEELKSIILKGDFRQDTGWGGLGYNNLVGAKAMQGLMAYYYDVVRPNVSVELNGCRYNYMGGANLYRGVPNYAPRRHPEWIGKCRADGTDDCENCETTDLALVQSVHYTNCRKPWNCIGVTWAKGQEKNAMGIDERNSNYTQCLKVVRLWHEYRTDLEDRVLALLSDEGTNSSRTTEEGGGSSSSAKQQQQQQLQRRMRSGTYKPETFMGHCQANGQPGYIPMADSQTAKLFSRIYDKEAS